MPVDRIENLNGHATENQAYHLESRSELAREIILERSGFLEKWALYIFLGILLLMLLAACIIRYPDIVDTKATLTAANMPKEIIPRQEGRLVKLFVNNNEAVKENEIFAWIESTASHKEVLELSSQVDSSLRLLHEGKFDKAAVVFKKDYLNLGEIQQGYQTFMSTLQLFNDYVNNGFYARKKLMMANDLQSLKNTSQAIQHQKKLTQDDVKLAEETFSMNKKLFEEKVLAQDELRQQSSKYINKQLAIHQLNASILSNELQQREKEKELEQLEHDMRQQPEIFQQSLQSLKSQIEEWKKKYVLQSAIDGRASYTIPIQENQFLQAGKTIGYIVPDNGRFYLTTYLPQGNFGKVDTGLAVQLRFDAYPYQENGAVTGTVSYISNIASDNGFLTTIRLDKGLVTNTNKLIPFKSGLTAQAMVITKNISLLNRLLYNVTKTFSVNNKEK